MKIASLMASENGNGKGNDDGDGNDSVSVNPKIVEATANVAKALRKQRAENAVKKQKAKEAVDTPDVKGIEAALTVVSRSQPQTWMSRLGPVGVAIEDWRRVMIEDLGGEEQVTAMQRVVVDLAARSLIMLDVVDQYIFDPEDQKIIDLDRKQVRFIVMQRKVLADSLEKYMRDLGFQRKRAAKTVNAIIEELAEVSDLDRASLEAAREPTVEDELRRLQEVDAARDEAASVEAASVEVSAQEPDEFPEIDYDREDFEDEDEFE